MIEKVDEQLNKGVVQGLIAFMLVGSLCYIVVTGDAKTQEAFKDLFVTTVSTGIGFYFGRETKSK